MKPQAALVWAKRRVELHTEASVDPQLTPVIDPRDPKNNLPFGFNEAFENARLNELGVLVENWLERVKHLSNSLHELVFTLAAALYGFNYGTKVRFRRGK